MPTEPITRESAILAEIESFRASLRPESEPTPAATSAEPLTREQRILQEISTLSAGLPKSHSEAVLSEVGGIQNRTARESQPIISGSSFLEKVLDVINTPEQALFGVLAKKPGEGVLQAAERGMRSNIRFADVLEGELNASPDVATGLLGLTGDVLLDPAVLVAGPVFKLGAKAATFAGKGGVSAAKAIAPDLSARLYESAVKPTVRLFSKTALRSEAEKELVTLTDLEISKVQARTQRILLEESEQRKIASELAKKLGKPEAELFADISRRVEVKTGSQLAFPFANIQESKKILSELPQGDLFGEFGRDFGIIEQHTAEAAKDLAAKTAISYPASGEREIALQVTCLKQRLENALVRERSFGVKTERLEDATVDYLTHLVTPAAKKQLVELPQFRVLGREFDARHGFQLARLLDSDYAPIAKVIADGGSADIATLNSLYREGRLFAKLGPQTHDLFLSDPYVVAAVRRIRGEKAIGDASILIKASASPHLAQLKDAAPASWRPLNLPADARFDRLRAYTNKFRYEPDVAAHLEATIEKTVLPEGMDKFLKLFDTAQGIWKGITLNIFPSYHLRNAVGNVWNNYLAGLNNPKWYLEALKVQRGKLTELQVAGRAMPMPQLKSMLEDFGIVGSTTFAAAETLRKGLPGLAGRAYVTAEQIPVVGKAVAVGLKTGVELENNARIAHFLFKLDKGATPTEAALSVKKYLFDYRSGLTDFEQSVMRRIFPFYSWTRFNIPLQIQSLVENPRPYIRLSDLVNTVRTKGIAGGKDFEEKAAAYRGEDAPYLAQFIKENAGVPVRIGPNGEPEFFLLASWIPAADLEVLGSKGGMFDRMKDLLSPFVKTPVEQIANRELFTGRELEQFPGETMRFLGIETRRRYAQVLKNVRLLAEADRVLKLWDSRSELEADQQSKLSALTRLLFGLKGYVAKPEIEARRINYERRERQSRLKGAIRANLPQAAEILSGETEEE